MASCATAAVTRLGRLEEGSSAESVALRLWPPAEEAVTLRADLGVFAGVEVREAASEGRPRFLALTGAGTSSSIDAKSSRPAKPFCSSSSSSSWSSLSKSVVTTVLETSASTVSEMAGPDSMGSSSSS